MTISASVTETNINASVTQLSNSVLVTGTNINASVSQTPVSVSVSSYSINASVDAAVPVSVVVTQSVISASVSGGGGSGGVTDHALLTHLDYASAGHTGFQASLTADVDYLTPATAALTYEPLLGFTPPPNTRLISTSTPLSGGGDLSADRTISISQAGVATDGYLSSVDWNTFNNKQSSITFPLAPNLGGTGISNLAGSTLTLGAATSITGGGTIALGGFTLTVPATGTAALLETANVFTVAQQITTTSGSSTLVLDFANNLYAIEFKRGGVTVADIYKNSSNRLIFNSYAAASTFAGFNFNGDMYIVPTTGASGLNVTSSQAVTRVNIDNTNASPNAGFGLKAGGVLKWSVAAYKVGSNISVVFYNDATATNSFFIDGGSNYMAIGHAVPLARLHPQEATTTTNAIAEVLRLESIVSTASTGSAAGFGVGLSFYAETATDATYQQQGLISTSWIDATNITRKAKMSLSVYDTAARLGIEIEASGTEAKLGFYGISPVARQLLATGAGASVDDVITALQNLGLLKQS